MVFQRTITFWQLEDLTDDENSSDHYWEKHEQAAIYTQGKSDSYDSSTVQVSRGPGIRAVSDASSADRSSASLQRRQCGFVVLWAEPLLCVPRVCSTTRTHRIQYKVSSDDGASWCCNRKS
jgi:hypothetical protein